MTDMKPLFDTVRQIKGAPLTQADVDAINSALDGGRTISAAGLALIKQYEGCKLTAYPDPGTGGAPWTIGYGHTGPEVKKGLTITQAQADAYLAADVAQFEMAVRGLCPVTTQGQFDALVSLAFNIGSGALSSSTLRKKHFAGDYAGAAAEFPKWRFAGGKELPGLVKRRGAERALYEGKA